MSWSWVIGSGIGLSGILVIFLAGYRYGREKEEARNSRDQIFNLQKQVDTTKKHAEEIDKIAAKETKLHNEVRKAFTSGPDTADIIPILRKARRSSTDSSSKL